MLTPEQIERNAHIPNEEVERDIADTEREIGLMRIELEGLRKFVSVNNDRVQHMRITARENGIREREEFIAKLRELLAARAASSASDARQEQDIETI